MKLKFKALIVMLAVAFALQVFADCDEAQKNFMATFYQAAQKFPDAVTADNWSGTMPVNDGVQAKRTLMAGVKYIFVLSGDSAVQDINVKIFNSSGTLVASDNSVRRDDVLVFDCNATDNYLIQVIHAQGSGPGCVIFMIGRM